VKSSASGLWIEKQGYRKIEKLPFIQLQSEIEQLISAMGQKTGTFRQLLREPGIRCGEAWNLKMLKEAPLTHSLRRTANRDSLGPQTFGD
jgi:hypothetical protein